MSELLRVEPEPSYREQAAEYRRRLTEGIARYWTRRWLRPPVQAGDLRACPTRYPCAGLPVYPGQAAMQTITSEGAGTVAPAPPSQWAARGHTRWSICSSSCRDDGHNAPKCPIQVLPAASLLI